MTPHKRETTYRTHFPGDRTHSCRHVTTCISQFGATRPAHLQRGWPLSAHCVMG
jgi:hypothetical protein